MKKWLAGTAVVAIAAVAAGVYLLDVFPGEIEAVPEVDRAAFPDDQIAAGENLALIGDCATCHTPRDAGAMSGGIALPTPFGTIYSTNITPDPETGIGMWSFAAFDRAMREGVDREGNHLYPAFPYDHFAAMTEDDMEALYQYLMTQEPVVAEDIPNELGFPFSFRPILAGWKFLFHHPEEFTPDPEFNDEENRGAYLGETLGHCSACHSPRNAFGAVKTSEFLAGGEAEGWLIPPLGAASISPLGWEMDDYLDYLFDGWSQHHGIAGGPMTPVIDNLYDAEEDDVFAIAAWLNRITPPVDVEERDARQKEIAALDLPETFDVTLDGAEVSDQIRQGAQVFEDSCVRCHKQRISETQPISLGLTYALNARAPTNLINVIRNGIQPSIGSRERKMEAIALSDEKLAAVVAFARWQFTDLPAWEDIEGHIARASGGDAGH